MKFYSSNATGPASPITRVPNMIDRSSGLSAEVGIRSWLRARCDCPIQSIRKEPALIDSCLHAECEVQHLSRCSCGRKSVAKIDRENLGWLAAWWRDQIGAV